MCANLPRSGASCLYLWGKLTRALYIKRNSKHPTTSILLLLVCLNIGILLLHFFFQWRDVLGINPLSILMQLMMVGGQRSAL